MKIQHVWKIGDCLQLLRGVSNSSVDLVLTDPPFNANIDYGLYKDNLSLAEYFEWVESWFKEVYRILKDTGTFLCFSNVMHIEDFLRIGRITGFIYRDTLIWYKPNGNEGIPQVPYKRYEPCYYWVKKSGSYYKLGSLTDVLFFNRETSAPHPCQRPVELYVKLIKAFTKEGDLVLDPFLGSGTTLKACRLSERCGMGFEINPEYEVLIKNRVMVDIPSLDTWFTEY